MEELLVVLGAEVVLVLSILAMKLYLWRTDVLAGGYVANEKLPQRDLSGWMKSLRKPAHPTPDPATSEGKEGLHGTTTIGGDK